MRCQSAVFVSMLVALVGMVPSIVCADTSTYPQPSTPSVSSQPARPSVNNEAFAQLRARCEKEASCGKVSGDICAEAASILMGIDPPDAFHEMSESQRGKIALRLLERGVDTSNIARALAYDMYTKTDFLGLSGYTDSFRGNELLDMMIKSGYPGGVLRKARSSVGILAFGSSEADKREACAMSKKMLDEGKLDAGSVSIAKEIVENATCQGFAQNK